MAIVAVVLCIFGGTLFIQFGALIEMYQQLKQVRHYLEIVDTPTPIALGSLEGARPSDIGLPAALDEAAQAMILFLSNKCETCSIIARSFAGTLPDGLWVVVVPESKSVSDARPPRNYAQESLQPGQPMTRNSLGQW